MAKIKKPVASRATDFSCGLSAGQLQRQLDLVLTIEPEFLKELQVICDRESYPLSAVCDAILKTQSLDRSFESAVRVFIMDYLKMAATEEGHARAGHGPLPAMFEIVPTIH